MQEFDLVVAAMKAVGVDDAQQTALWRVLAALLHCGNVTFKAGAEDVSEVPPPPSHPSVLPL